MGRTLGSWAFLIGVILAVIIGALNISNQLLIWLLVVIGLVVGFLNITDKEVKPFLMAGTVLVIVSYFGGQKIMEVLPIVGNILDAMLYMFVPATIIVALKSVFEMAKR